MLTRAEKRALAIAFDISSKMPDFPDTISIGEGPSKERTLQGLCEKGMMMFAPYRSRYYVTELGISWLAQHGRRV